MPPRKILKCEVATNKVTEYQKIINFEVGRGGGGERSCYRVPPLYHVLHLYWSNEHNKYSIQCHTFVLTDYAALQSHKSS